MNTIYNVIYIDPNTELGNLMLRLMCVTIYCQLSIVTGRCDQLTQRQLQITATNTKYMGVC